MKFQTIALGLITAGLTAGLWILPGAGASPAEAGPRYGEARHGKRVVRRERQVRRQRPVHRAHRVRRVPRAPRVHRIHDVCTTRRVHRRAWDRPWVSRDVVWIDGYPARYHAGLEIYIGGLGLQIEIGNDAPRGYVYQDPYCDLEFSRVDEYRRHARKHKHRAVLDLYEVDVHRRR